MKKLYPLLSVLFLIYWGCDDPKEKDTEKPTVTIISPQSGSIISDSVTITCMSSDNEGVEKVELWVNGVSSGIIDETEPYSLEWNTLTYDDGSYGITVRSYDTSGNTTDSDPITLIVQHCTNCGGGLVDGYLYKEVTFNDIAGLAEIDVAVDVGKCIRFRMDGTDFSEATLVDDCCCILYR